MLPSTFDYVAPTSLDEAVQALAAGAGDAKIMAGGQSLLPMMKLRLASPATIIDPCALRAAAGPMKTGQCR